MGHAVRHQCQGVSRHQMCIRQRRILRQSRGMGHCGTARIDPDMLTRQTIWRQTSILQRLPDDLQQKPLLRVHLPRLARRYAERSRVKCPQIIYDACCKSIGLPLRAWHRMQEKLP